MAIEAQHSTYLNHHKQNNNPKMQLNGTIGLASGFEKGIYNSSLNASEPCVEQIRALCWVYISATFLAGVFILPIGIFYDLHGTTKVRLLAT